MADIQTFRMTKEIQEAKDFGLKWFDNGASKQIVYHVWSGDDKIGGVRLKTHISTKYDKVMYCHVLKMETKNGSDSFEYKFTTNPLKKYYAKVFQTLIAK